MRPSTLLLAAALMTATFAVALHAADSTESTTPPAPTNVPAESTAPAPATPQAPAATDAQAAAAPTADASVETTPAPQDAAPEAAPEAVENAPTARAEPTTQAAPAAPQVITAQVDPELALRLSLLEKTILAQTAGQSAIYNETSRLLMFFGSACVAMGLIAMVAAVFLMNRTLASVSAITGQVAQSQGIHALPTASSALMPATAPGAGGFERVQASGQRFQNRMTSLEQRLQELEHLAGHDGADHASAASAPAESSSQNVEPGPAPVIERPAIPMAAILVRKAEALMNLGKLGDAMSVLDEAASHEGDLSDVHLARGRVLEKMGRLGDALQSYDLAVTNDEKNTAALLMKAGVLNRQERFDEALTCYERALAVHRAGA